MATSGLWATARYGSVKINIYMLPGEDIENAAGLTHWHHGRCTIELNQRLLRDRNQLDRVLFHEFIHVIEYLNDPEFLSIEVVDNCTELAQTMERAMWELFRSFRTVKPNAHSMLGKAAKRPARRPRG